MVKNIQTNNKIFLLAIILILVASGILSLTLINPEIGAAQSAGERGSLNLSLVEVDSGYSQPVGLAQAGPGDNRLFVVERAGQIKISQPGAGLSGGTFLNITSRVDSSQSEEGLLGLVFHPDYATNGSFYVNYTYTPTSGSIRRTRISRFQVTADPNVADPNSEEILLTVTQPEWNHNAGGISFGPDGYLYIPLGDGGSGGDPWNNAQTLTTLLGKITRIDVDSGPGDPSECSGAGTGNYTIPTSNPFRDGGGPICDEIWALGLRNPWRSSFDSQTGDFYLGDVGQQLWEEVDFQPASSTGGENYGWNCREGKHPYSGAHPSCGPSSNYDEPIFEYANDSDTCAVVGGYVYRGGLYPEMFGRYFLADYCDGDFWDLIPGSWASTRHNNLAAFSVSSFGEASDGELYVTGYSNGKIYHLVEDTVVTPTPSPTPTETPTPTPTATCVPNPTPDPTATPGGPPLDQEHYLPIIIRQEVSYCW